MRNKVLIYSPSSNIWGGGQIYIDQLGNYLNSNGLDTYILTSEPDTFTCKAREMESVNSKKDRLLNSIKIIKDLKKDGFNVIILNDLASLWLAPIFKLNGFKTISLLHLFLEKVSENPLGHSIFEYNILKISAKFADEIFSVNKNNQKVFGDKVRFIGNYVPNWFIESEKSEDAGKYDFIIIARFAKQKNIPLFLELLNNLNNKLNKNYKALLVGNGPEKELIEDRIKYLKLENNVFIQDWVERSQLPQVFDFGKCFVISSYHEGFATTLLEAHARGLSAISTKSAGFCAEFIENYGAKTGLVYEPNDIDNIDFLEDLVNLIECSKSYRDLSIQKAKIFSEDNVLGPIYKACKQ